MATYYPRCDGKTQPKGWEVDYFGSESVSKFHGGSSPNLLQLEHSLSSKRAVHALRACVHASTAGLGGWFFLSGSVSTICCISDRPFHYNLIKSVFPCKAF